MTATLCPACGNPLPPDAPQGQCPRCLLAAGLDSLPPEVVDGPLSAVAAAAPVVTPAPHMAVTRSYAGHARFQPLTVEELQAKIPNYEIQELIGVGGMGAVYKARQKGLGRLVAIKVLPGEISGSPDFLERFSREARALALLSHPHIVAVHDFGQAEGICYFVMEYVDGVNLRQALQAGKMDTRQALAIVPQICDALQFAHDEGVVHRDIKPENILIDKRGRVKIADFGLAKLLGPDTAGLTLTGTQQVMGTLRYMAPEQMSGAKEVDHRADIFSLGVVFYELLTGELPIGRFAPPSKKAAVDARLDEVVLRALEAEPELRYQQVSELKTGVEAAKQPAPLNVAPPSAASVRSQPPLPSRSHQPLPERLEPTGGGDAFWGTPVSLAVCGVLSFFLLAFVLYTAPPMLEMAAGPDTNLLKLGRQWGLGDTVAKVVASLFLVFLILGGATLWAWWKFQSARQPQNLTASGALANAETVAEPRVSRAALWGAILIPVFLLSLIMLAATTTAFVVPVRMDHSGQPQPVVRPMWTIAILMIPLLIVELIGLASPIVTTILGVVAIGNIRHSRGKLYGMPLAVFDALLFPLLLLDLILLGVGFLLFAAGLGLLLNRMHPESAVVAFAPMPIAMTTFLLLPLIAVLDVWLIRLTWRAAIRDLPGEASETKPLKQPLTGEPTFESRPRSSGALIAVLILVAIGIIPLVLCGGLAAAWLLAPITPQSKNIEATMDAHGRHEHEMVLEPVSERAMTPVKPGDGH